LRCSRSESLGHVFEGGLGEACCQAPAAPFAVTIVTFVGEFLLGVWLVA
jgi:hypothetical protein